MKTTDQIIKDFHKSKEVNFINYLKVNPLAFVEYTFKDHIERKDHPYKAMLDKAYKVLEDNVNEQHNEIMYAHLNKDIEFKGLQGLKVTQVIIDELPEKENKMLEDFDYLSLDFEYRGTNQPIYDLVCVAITDGDFTKAIWLHDNQENKDKYKNFMKKLRDSHILLSWNVDAEAKGLIGVGLDPTKFQWIDLQAEYKMLTNSNDELHYGEQFKEGKFIHTSRKKYGDKDKDNERHDKVSTSLLSATFKLLQKGSTQDYERKEEMRKLCMYNETFDQEEQDEILEYCTGDIAELKDILDAIVRHYSKLLDRDQFKNLKDAMLYRGNIVARTALVSSIGYPVSREKVTNFTNNVPKIIQAVQLEINEQFPEMQIFRPKGKKGSGLFSLNTLALKKWIKESDYANHWMKTKGKGISLKLDAWEQHFSFRHDFPDGNLPAQILRWLKLNQSLNGFKPKSVTAKNPDTFFSYYGDDDRAHPYLNSHGSQTDRFQPKALGYLHLKSAWMRSMVEPEEGRAIAAIDYGSQEFFISALLSGDENMIEAYLSGDVYLHFAKLAGAVPMDGTRDEYKKERNLFKSTVLGLSYGMGAAALARKLTMDTGIPHDKADAQELITLFFDAFPDYQQFTEDVINEYNENDMLQLNNDWILFGDNDNAKSVGNFLVQGAGAAILQEALVKCQDAGLSVIILLHDALYIEYDYKDFDKLDIFADCMRDAFAEYFVGQSMADYDIAHENIRLDLDVWSPNYPIGDFETPGGMPGKMQKLYIDERAETEYHKFKQYFKK